MAKKHGRTKELRPSSAAIIAIVYALFFGACGLLLGRTVAIYLLFDEIVLGAALVGLLLGIFFGILLSMMTAESAPYAMLMIVPISIVILFEQPGYKENYGNLIILIGLGLVANAIAEIKGILKNRNI